MTRPRGAPDVEGVHGAIEAGQSETGYPTVGAIIAHDAGDPPEGHLCTGTLVSQSWVLTAQHCEGTNMVFKTGNSIWSNFVDHAVDLQVRHPRLDQMLIHLSTPIEGVGVLRGRATATRCRSRCRRPSARPRRSTSASACATQRRAA